MINNVSIIKLIKDEKYETIINFLKNLKNLDSLTHNLETGTDKPILVRLIENNNKVIVKYLLENFPKLLYKRLQGVIPFHTIYRNNGCDMIKNYLSKNLKAITSIGSSGADILLLATLYDDYTLLENILNNPNIAIDVNKIYPGSNTLLLSSIRNYILTKKLNIITLLLSFGANPNIPYNNTPLQNLKNIHECSEVLDLLNKSQKLDINSSNNLLSLAISFKNEELEKFIYKFEDYKYTVNDLLTTIINLKESAARMIIPKVDKNDINNYRNIDNETILMIALRLSLPDDIICILIYYNDINNVDVNKNTALHLIAKNYQIQNFGEFLKIKRKSNINVNIKDSHGNKPIDYLNEKSKLFFINIFRKNLIKYKIKNKLLKTIPLKKVHTTIFSDNFLMEIILSYYLQTKYINKVNIPTISNNIDMKTNINMVSGSNLPWQKWLNTKKINIYNTNIDTQLRLYTTQLYRYLPSYIVLVSGYFFNYYSLDFYIRKAYYSKSNFVCLFIPVIHNIASMSVLLYDKVNKVIEIFDPIGITSKIDHTKFDNYIVNIFTNIQNSPVSIEYPIFYVIDQNHEQSIVYKKYGDPDNFCLSWCMWFIESRILNPNITMNKLLSTFVSNLAKKFNKESMTTFIRNYTNKLDQEKNKIYKKAGLSSYHYYDKKLNAKDFYLVARVCMDL